MVKVDEVIGRLAGDNKRAKPEALRLAAEAAMTYAEASENVQRLGAVVVHPKSGAPIENPYLSIRERQSRILKGIKTVDTGTVIGWIEEQFAAQAAKEA